MGVKSLQIDAEVPIKVQQGAPLYDVKRQLAVDDIEGYLEMWATRLEQTRLLRKKTGKLQDKTLAVGAMEKRMFSVQRHPSKSDKQRGQGERQPALLGTGNSVRSLLVGKVQNLEIVPGTGDKVMYPYDVCMDGNGTLWVVGRGETAEHVVQYSTDGTAMAGFDLKNSSYYRGIAVDMRTNHILVTDRDQGEVQVFRPDGSLVRTVRHPLGEMTCPHYVTLDGEGNILVSDWRSNYVYVYDESGKILFQFGGLGSGKVSGPAGICTDSSGHILVADSVNERIQIFTRHGRFVRTVRTGFKPEGLAVGPEGQLVVTSWFNNSVTVFPDY
ncbi:tripartite motif-containing protein 3-like [Branchiostoma floridae]|uniref:Tripartite motif-containing protein 3-like n=1 Tax=Branchiostoma floridae TaxID=7739 RepID=A0A9J7HGW1_BRAFL|nr:tripartite motif-containing protein 3-like [Branchiostoma floridae]